MELSSDEERAKTHAFNHKLSEGSLGLLPPAAACEKLKAASLTAGHTNTGLRCIRGQVACSIPEISVEGRMNAAKIAEADAAFGKAISDGLHWLVISSKIVHGCPGLVQLLQAAGNAPAQIQKYENEVQVLLRIHNAAKVNKTADGHIDWEAVKRTVNRSKPPCHADVPFLMHFVSRKAGSLDEAFLLQDLENFHKMHVPTDRVVRGGFFESLANFELSPTNLAPFWTLAMLKSQYSCPPNKVKSGECKYISTGDVKNSSGLWKDDVAIAESMLQQCRQMLQQHFVVLSKKTELLGKLDVRMVCLVMNKLEKNRSAFDTMEHVCHNFATELQEHLGADTDVQSPWSEFIKTYKPTRSASSSANVKAKDDDMDFVCFSVSGELADPMDVLRKRGINVDVRVHLREGDKMHQVLEMSDGFLKLQPDAKSKPISVSIADFLQTWQVAESAADNEDPIVLSSNASCHSLCWQGLELAVISPPILPHHPHETTCVLVLVLVGPPCSLTSFIHLQCTM